MIGSVKDGQEMIKVRSFCEEGAVVEEGTQNASNGILRQLGNRTNIFSPDTISQSSILIHFSYGGKSILGVNNLHFALVDEVV